MASPLVGAWELESDTIEGLFIYTEKHYSSVAMPKGRQRSESEEPTSEEALESYRGVRATTGTYTVSGSTITHQRTANLNANLIGVELVAEFSIDGDKMNISMMSGSGGPSGVGLILRKVS